MLWHWWAIVTSGGSLVHVVDFYFCALTLLFRFKFKVIFFRCQCLCVLLIYKTISLAEYSVQRTSQYLKYFVSYYILKCWCWKTWKKVIFRYFKALQFCIYFCTLGWIKCIRGASLLKKYIFFKFLFTFPLFLRILPGDFGRVFPHTVTYCLLQALIVNLLFSWMQCQTQL
jgi:hypothetical protein